MVLTNIALISCLCKVPGKPSVWILLINWVQSEGFFQLFLTCQWQQHTMYKDVVASRFEGRLTNVHIPNFPVFWEKQILYHVDHSQFWKHHLSAFYVYNSVPSWIVIKTWSWDALSLLGYEAEEHQLFATNPLNSLEKFYGQFLMLETLVTSQNYLCAEWKAVTSYEQSDLLGNGGWLIWGMALGSRPYYNQVLNLDLSG